MGAATEHELLAMHDLGQHLRTIATTPTSVAPSLQPVLPTNQEGRTAAEQNLDAISRQARYRLAWRRAHGEQQIIT